ncbi:MAG TPA: Hsp70 family protein, partial [Candidatus Nitrosotenuis sp.]|nr:Hsp70 family protein [Candidatus Nitrosotenuis sp.]
MPTVLGIDLGVSQCRTALARDGAAESFANRFSDRRLPLIVRSVLDTDAPAARLVFRGILQELGLDDPASLPNGTSPSQAAEEIFRGVREDARERAGEDVVHAVVTVPAFFLERKRAALRKAAEAAGFERAHLLDESLAALLGAKPFDSAKRVLIFAMGAGICAASVVRLLGGVPQAECHEGESELGGDDFDAAIVGYILEQLGLTADQFRDGANSVQKLRAVAEQVKIGLSKRTEEEFDVHPKELFSDAALEKLARATITLSLTREKFEAMIAEDVEHALGVAQKALDEAGNGQASVDAVVLAGGSTRIPLIEQRLRAQFGAEMVRIPDDAMARGAALHGARLGADAWQRREERVHSGPPPEAPPRRVALLPRDYAQPAEQAGWAGMFAPTLQSAEAMWQAGKQLEAIALMERVQAEMQNYVAHLYFQCGSAAYRTGIQALENKQYAAALEDFQAAIVNSEKALKLDAAHKDARHIYHR